MEVFAADPGELGLPSEVRRLQDGEPAALAGVRPEPPPPPQLGPELLTVGGVVPAQRPPVVNTLSEPTLLQGAASPEEQVVARRVPLAVVKHQHTEVAGGAS